MTLRIALAAICISAFGLGDISAQPTQIDLFNGFEDGWDEAWLHRTLAGKANRWETDTDDDNKSLVAESFSSASGYWYSLAIRPGNFGRIAWKWKLEDVLSGDISERRKRGDDYGARVYVVFEPHIVSWKTRAICYVWSGQQPPGESYPNPYARDVQTVVLQSGDEKEGEWISESRDFVRDYKKIWDEHPPMVTAVMLMVDTDNTNQEAITFFDELMIEYNPPKKEDSETNGTRTTGN